MKLTKRQREVLEWAARPEGLITSVPELTLVASDCAHRGWVRDSGPTFWGNVCWRVTEAGRKALEENQ